MLDVSTADALTELAHMQTAGQQRVEQLTHCAAEAQMQTVNTNSRATKT
jgi:hypothetical protein